MIVCVDLRFKHYHKFLRLIFSNKKTYLYDISEESYHCVKIRRKRIRDINNPKDNFYCKRNELIFFDTLLTGWSQLEIIFKSINWKVWKVLRIEKLYEFLKEYDDIFLPSRRKYS